MRTPAQGGREGGKEPSPTSPPWPSGSQGMMDWVNLQLLPQALGSGESYVTLYHQYGFHRARNSAWPEKNNLPFISSAPGARAGTKSTMIFDVHWLSCSSSVQRKNGSLFFLISGSQTSLLTKCTCQSCSLALSPAPPDFPLILKSNGFLFFFLIHL